VKSIRRSNYTRAVNLTYKTMFNLEKKCYSAANYENWSVTTAIGFVHVHTSPTTFVMLWCFFLNCFPDLKSVLSV
jgi:hypothetical protein